MRQQIAAEVGAVMAAIVMYEQAIPTQLGVEYNLHALGAILEHVAPALGWR
jgi:hypothetical protein